MKLSREEVEHIALLARIGLSEEEVERFRKELSSILSYFSRLQEVNTEGVPPTSHVIPLSNVMREDEIAPSLPPEEVLSNAPEVEEGFIKVPPILEG